MNKEPSWLAYILAIILLTTSLVGALLMLVQLFQGYDTFEHSLTGLAAWVQDILDDPDPKEVQSD